MLSGTISLLRVGTHSFPINSENLTTSLNGPHYTFNSENLTTLNLTIDLELHQHLVSLKHMINIIMWIRDMRCYNPPPKTKSHPEIVKEKCSKGTANSRTFLLYGNSKFG
jgi:hypothetical protein